MMPLLLLAGGRHKIDSRSFILLATEPCSWLLRQVLLFWHQWIVLRTCCNSSLKRLKEVRHCWMIKKKWNLLVLFQKIKKKTIMRIGLMLTFGKGVLIQSIAFTWKIFATPSMNGSTMKKKQKRILIHTMMGRNNGARVDNQFCLEASRTRKISSHHAQELSRKHYHRSQLGTAFHDASRFSAMPLFQHSKSFCAA